MDFRPQVDHSYRPEVICSKRLFAVPSHEVFIINDLRRLKSTSSPILSSNIFVDYVDAYV